MIKALIFDFDGVITDTEPVHMEAWLGVLEDVGISFDEDEYKRDYIGLNDRDFLDVLTKKYGHHFDDIEKARYIEEKTARTIELLNTNVPLLPGVKDFVESTAKKYLLAICSGATHGEIEFVLKRLKWTQLFNPVVSSDVVKRGKPDPEGYIRAIEAVVERADDLILPENIIAIEDSPKGIAAAHAAGIKCLAVGNSFSRAELSKADWFTESIADFDLNSISG